MSGYGSKTMPFPQGSSGNGMVDGGSAAWEKNFNLWVGEQGEEPEMEPIDRITDPVIQAGVDEVYEVLLTTQSILEALLAMPIDQIQRLKDRLYESLEEFREEWI